MPDPGLHPISEREIFLSALDLPEGTERESYLADACGGDASLRDRLDALLLSHDESAEFLENGSGVTGGDIASVLPKGRTLTGTVFGDYELREEIGRGAMGVVWKARQKSLQREVALKMVHGGIFSSDEEVARAL